MTSGVGNAWDDLRRRWRTGELGSVPVIVGLLVIWALLALANPRFLSPVNLTNLMLQIAAMGTISVGIVLVLLLGEIDLSVGSVSGLAAAVMAVLNVKAGMPGAAAVFAALAVGLGIGMFNGLWITRFRVPSFVVTLAGLIGWLGLQLYVLGDTGTINLRDPFITGLAGTFLPAAVGWLVAAGILVGYGAALVLRRRRRQAAGLPVRSPTLLAFRFLAVAVPLLAAMAVLNADRGLPLAVVIFVGLTAVFDLITTRTRFGRNIYAVGGSAEAAMRAGIPVSKVRIAVFGLCSMMAALGGVLAASRLLAVNQSSGSGDLLLNAIAAAVIGGTSLFGGRGTVWAALLGALVIGSISNGMDLLALSSSVKFMVTGSVLLLAVTIDAVTRHGRETSGLA